MSEAKFTIREKDLVAANRLHARQLWNRGAVLRGWGLATVALVLILFSICGHFGWMLLWAPAAAALFMAVGAAIAYLTFSNAARRHYHQAEAFWIPTSIDWDDTSIRFASERGNVQIKWADFFAWAVDDRSILLYQSGNSFITVPTKSLGENAKFEIPLALKNAGVAVRSSR